MDILLAILLGGFFGYALYKVGATNFKNILNMLRLEDLTLAKSILFAIGLSSTLLALASFIGIFDVGNLSVKTMNTGVILGGAIFGLGFGSAGTCPGTCVGAATGENYKKAFSAIIGGLIGAFTFSMTYEWLNNNGLISSIDMGKLTLFKISQDYPAVFENIGFIGVLGVGIIFIVIALVLPKSLIKNK